MNQAKDLTRWNRAGLRRFRYVDGNAVTYLETLRQLMMEQFTDPNSGKLQWEQLRDAIPVPHNESVRDRQQRWLTQYHAERRDFAWEILRTFARSLHVLTEHLDAYANESYLSTATQWDNVRKLVDMLDYHPAPPASAFTSLALMAKPNQTGTLTTGFQVKNQPEDGSASVIFETLADIQVDWRLNKLYLKDWNKSQKLFEYQPCLTDATVYCANFPINKKPKKVSVGTLGILIIEPANGLKEAVPITVTGLTDNEIQLQGSARPLNAKYHQIHLLLNPKAIQTPLISGANVFEISSNHGLVAKDFIAWSVSNKWYAAQVDLVERDRIKITGDNIPPQDTAIYKLHAAKTQTFKPSVASKLVNRIVLPTGVTKVWDNNATSVTTQTETETGANIYNYVTSPYVMEAFFLPDRVEAVGTVKNQSVQELEFEGSPGDLASEQWVIVSGTNGKQARTIAAITKKENSYVMALAGEEISDKNATIYANFSEPLRPLNYDKNAEVIGDPAQKSDVYTVLPLALDTLPDSLKEGRQLIVKNSTSAFPVTIVEVDKTNALIKVTPPVPGTELTPTPKTMAFRRFDTVILGNIVEAGHGETQLTTILGSGDATQSNQTFLFEIEAISFVKDMIQSSGVRADIRISINDRTWQQVTALNDSSPTDPHYVVRMTEDGYLQIKFGDGYQGQRLPTGNNNVRIHYRTGVGLSGNLPAHSLVKAVKPHPLIDSVEQPLLANGGNAMESIESLRANAPASVLTLQRAVSLSDFKHLAASHSSVWQAHAYRVPTGLARHDSIKVVVVPAGGGELGDLAEELAAFLQAHALPGVQVTVVNFSPIILNLDIIIRVKTTEYDADKVVNSAQSALLNAFSLEQSQLGQPLFRSQLYEVVEAVTGGENSVCTINPNRFAGAALLPRHVTYGADGVVKSVQPHPDQVIYLDKTHLTVTATAFSV
jgi:hypothetical protein